MTAPVVLLTTNLARGGAETQVALLALSLKRRGWPVSVVSLLDPSAFQAELAAAGVQVHSLGMRPGRPNPLAAARLAAILRQERPCVLHSHMFHANLLARLMSLAFPTPLIVSTLHSMAESSRHSTGTRWRDWLYRATDPLADATVAVCQAVAERHAASGAVQRGKLRVIPNGVDTGRFRPDAARRDRLRAELGAGDEFVWLAVGRLMWKKDYPTMLRAAARLRVGTLFIAGAGPLEPELAALARELRVRAHFLGSREDVPALMNAADGLVLSSVVEGLPMVLLEAAASGLPCVTTDAGGARDAVVDGQTGFLAPRGNPEALASAMTRLVELPGAARREMGQTARELALARFDMGAVTSQWEQLYRQATGLRFGGAGAFACQPATPMDLTLPEGAPSELCSDGQAEACPTTGTLDVTNRFVLDFAMRFARQRGGARVLDFGCGAGRLVQAGLAAGLDMAGADVYYGGSKTRAEAEQSGLLGAAVREIRDGRLDYATASFDLVLNNQVLEHVADLDGALAEIHRVLKADGAVLSIFPARDVFREGHIGIPFAHWFPRNSQQRFYYVWGLRRLGLGTWKQEAPTCRQWAVEKLAWMDAYTHYRGRREIFDAFGRLFASQLRESDYIRFRLLDRPGRKALAALADAPIVAAAARAVFRKLAFLVIVSRKEAR
jgi:glycosyltransferase involved in cell wall biosynthesis/SAM-dependent methyltransferase